MSIDEAIERCETFTTKGHIIFSRDPDIAEECNEKYKQLAEWLEELKSYREIGTVEECKNSVLNILKAYNKAIDDFVKMLYEELLYEDGLTEIDGYYIAEQLKAGASDGNG